MCRWWPAVIRSHFPALYQTDMFFLFLFFFLHKGRMSLMHSICRICKTALIITNLSQAAFQIAYYVSLKSRTHKIEWFFWGSLGDFSLPRHPAVAGSACSASVLMFAVCCHAKCSETVANCCQRLLYRSYPGQINIHECRSPLLARPRTLKLIRKKCLS